METSNTTINNVLSTYMNLSVEDKKRKGAYRSKYFRMFDYPDGISSIVIENTDEIKVGADFRDHRGRLHVVTEVISQRSCKGIFSNEENRQIVVFVKSEIIPGI